MKRRLKNVAIATLLMAVGSAEPRPARGQSAVVGSQSEQTAAAESSSKANKIPADPDYDNSLGLHFLKSFANDQKTIWTSPARIRFVDVDWLLPFGLTTAGMFGTDSDFSKHLSNSPSRIQNSKDFSDYGLALLAGAGAGSYVWGHIVHDAHRRETG